MKTKATKRKTKAKKPVTLPDKLSELLRLAVKDCKAVEKMKTRRLRMNTWHTPVSNHCEMCMAGAVMDRTLHVSRYQYVPSLGEFFNGRIARKLLAIDGMRRGDLYDASLNALGTSVVPGLVGRVFQKMVLDNYDDDVGRATWRTYLKAADMLEKAGY